MKKRNLVILIILVLFILTFSLSSNIFAEDLIHGVAPAKVTANLHEEYPDAAGAIVIVDNYWEFWNVGKLGGEQYSNAKLTITYKQNGPPAPSIWEGYFTGGPNGDIYVESSGSKIHVKLNSGSTITYGNGKSFPVDNPQAFKGWVDKEISIAPTIDLSILEGPVENEDGKTYNFIVEAVATGTPEPDISFNRDDSGGSLGPNNALITMERDQEFTVKATAANTAGSVSAETILSTKNIKPMPDLTIVIPGGYPGFGPKDTKIEVKNGIIDSVISYNNFDNVPIKGTYDPEKGVINATITIAPQHDTANLWLGFEGNLTIDLSKNNTAGFMTISGNMWQWTEDDGKWEEGDDKGPAGDYSQRVYYTVEYPEGQPEEPADLEPGSEPVDSNLHFWLTSSVNPSSEYINCFIKRAGSSELEQVNEKTRINVGDTIVNPPGGKIVIIFPTDSRDSGIGLNPGTNFTISGPTDFLSFGEFIYKAAQNRQKSGLGVEFDSFETQLAKLKVKLKGTTVVFKEDGQTSSVKVLEGVAECTDIETGKTVEVRAGEMIEDAAAGIGEVKVFDTGAENAKWAEGLKAISEISAETIQETSESASITQADTIQESAGTTIQKTSAQFPATYIILIILGVLIVLAAVVLVLILVKRKHR